MKKSKYVALGVIALLFQIGVVGCDSSRLNQFSTFASAGSVYIQSFHTLVQQAGSAMITSDSATMFEARQRLVTDPKGATVTWDPQKDKHEQEIANDDQALQQYLANLQLIDRHATLLGSYFNAIAQLTNGKQATTTVAAADNLVDSINKLDPAVEQAKFANVTVKQFLQPVITLVVDHFEVKALNDELKRDASAIDQALNLEQAAVTAIGAQIRASTNATLQVQEQTDVILPYAGSGQLSEADWNSKRLAFLQTQATLQNLDSATKAITDLRTDFQQLVQNKNAAIDFNTLMNDINSVASYVAAVESGTTKTTTTKK